MIRVILVAAATVSLLSTAAIAAPCKDPKTGKFVKCQPPKSAAAPKRCRDAKGHFAKCGTPGAKPA
jgi:hypothetical protein